MPLLTPAGATTSTLWDVYGHSLLVTLAAAVLLPVVAYVTRRYLARGSAPRDPFCHDRVVALRHMTGVDQENALLSVPVCVRSHVLWQASIQALRLDDVAIAARMSALLAQSDQAFLLRATAVLPPATHPPCAAVP